MAGLNLESLVGDLSGMMKDVKTPKDMNYLIEEFLTLKDLKTFVEDILPEGGIINQVLIYKEHFIVLWHDPYSNDEEVTKDTGKLQKVLDKIKGN